MVALGVILKIDNNINHQGDHSKITNFFREISENDTIVYYRIA